MQPRRTALCAAVLPLALLVTWDTPHPGVSAAAGPRDFRGAAAHAGSGAPRPAIVSRAAWRADESLAEDPVKYTGRAKAVVVHHTSHSRTYECAEVPGMLRSLQRDHVRREGWNDLGYHFLVDR